MKAEHKLEQFQAGLQNELDWLNRVEEKVQDRGWNTDPSNAESVMEELTVSLKFLFSISVERKKKKKPQNYHNRQSDQRLTLSLINENSK